jgi:hypothetical protein
MVTNDKKVATRSAEGGIGMSVPERPSKGKRHYAWHVLLNVRPLPRKKASTYGYNHNVQVVPLA